MGDDTWHYPVPYPVSSSDDALSRLERRRRAGGSVGWRRPAARIIDVGLLVAPVVWLFWAVSGQPPKASVDDWQFGLQILAVVGSVVWFLVAWPIYEAVAVAVSGRTLGKWLTGLCVVDEDAGRIRVGSLLGRTFLLVAAFVATFLAGLWFWAIYPPLAAIPVAALALSQAIPALGGTRTWLDVATGTDVIRRSRRVGPEG